MIKIFFLLLLALNAFSSEFNIDFYEDKANSLKIEDIVNIIDFDKTSSNIAKGYSKSAFWYKIALNNATENQEQINILLNEVHNDQVDFYLVINDKVENYFATGLQRVDKDAKVTHTQPLYRFTLSPGEIKDIYIRVWSSSSHTYSIKVFSNKALNEYTLIKERLLSLYVGAILALLLYNLFLYISLREISYLYYILFGGVFLLSHIHLMGYYPTEIYPSLRFTYNMSVLFPLWFAIFIFFTREILKTKYYLPKIDPIIKYTGYLLLALTLLAFIELYLAIFIMNILMLIILPILIVLAIAVLKKGYKVAVFYIFAEILFVVSNTIFGLLFAGAIEYNVFTRYSYFVGSLAEIILFSLALGYATYSLKQENQKQKELVDEYSKLSFLGQTVINIYHQWKAPVNNIYNSINHIETAKEFRDENLNAIIDENLTQIKDNTHYLRETALGYLGFYKDIEQVKKQINVCSEVQSVVKLIELESSKLDLKVKIECDSSIEILIQKNYFSNMLMILFENSINVFKLRGVKKPCITIAIEQYEERLKLLFMDNGGGIIENPSSKIFEKSHSTSSSTGIGLYLLKEFLLKKIGGEIDVENTQDGASFIIEIKTQKEP